MNSFLNTKDIKIYIDGQFIAGAEHLSLSRSRRMHKGRSCLQNNSANIVNFGTECTICLEKVLLTDENTVFEDECRIEIVGGNRKICFHSCFWTKREWIVKNGTAYETWVFICEDWEETAV